MSEPLSNKKHRYECICCHCGKPFYGDKREVSCPNCSKTNRSLSKILNFEHKQHTPSSDSGVVTGYNQAIDDLDQRSPDVEKLARIIYEQQYNRNININSRCPDWKKEAPYVKERFVLLAQEIINKIDVWVVKESSGQCNHEFMQQYDFSKFSNAGNSLKCVKCGLIKKG